jgi:hypothetical protein
MQGAPLRLATRTPGRSALVNRGVSLLLLVLAALMFWIRLPVLIQTLNTYPWDGKVDWLAARAFLAGENPYSPAALAADGLDGLGHPPTTSFWFIPLALLDMQGMSKVLGTLSIALLLVQCVLVARELKWRFPVAIGSLLGVAVLYREWMRFHLHLAQLSQVLSFLFVLTWMALRRGRDWLAGVPLGIACTLKVFPGLVAIFLLLSRRWRAVVVAGLLYLTVAATMTARFGVESWTQFFSTEHIIVDMWIGNLRNASLYGIFVRAFSPVCIRQPGAIPVAMALGSLTLALLFALSMTLWSRVPEGPRAIEPYRTDLPFMMMVVLAIFGNLWVFEHYYALLVPPLAMALTGTWSAHRNHRLPRAGILLLVLALAGIIALLWIEPWTHLNPRLLRTPRFHAAQHLWEFANWLPFVLLLFSYAALLWAGGRDLAVVPVDGPRPLRDPES